MTKKEEQPKKNKEERRENNTNLPFNPDITPEDKEVLNNQSLDEQKGEYFKDRERPVDFEGDDLDIPKVDEKQFNETKNEADEATREKRPKESANSNNNIEDQSETVYRGEKAEEYKDPSKKKRSDKSTGSSKK